LTELKDHKYILLVFLLFLSLGYTCKAQVKSNSRLAFEYFNDNEWNKAAPLFKELFNGNNSKTYLNYYIRCLTELKEFDEAEKELRKIQRQTKDVGYYVDLAYLFELQGERKKSDLFLEKPFKDFPRTEASIRNLSNTYVSYRKFDHAQRAFTIGRKILGQSHLFRVDVANLYRLQRRHEEMVDEYLAVLLTQPNYISAVENYLRSALIGDIDENLLEIVQNKTLEYIQQFPGLAIFSELLIWVYIQQNNYESAVDQAISLDIRSRNVGQQTLALARQSRQAGDFKSSLRAYDYLISLNTTNPNPSPNKNSRFQSPISSAFLESKQTRLEQLESRNDNNPDSFKTLHNAYEQTLNKLDDALQKARAYRDMSYINMYYLGDYTTGLIEIDSAVNLTIRHRQINPGYLLDKADFLVISGDPWTATLLYARIEKENRENPIASVAKLRKAQLAFYTGDFSWALSQLNVLKGSSSKLIANDAFEMAGMIKSNQSDTDSLSIGLKLLSQAYQFRFQKKNDSCLAVLDSLIQKQDNPARDDALFMKAEILLEQNRNRDASDILKMIIQNYQQDIWGHKAIFKLGLLYLEEGNLDEADKQFKDLVSGFPNSFYNLDAREYIRSIKTQEKNSTDGS